MPECHLRLGSPEKNSDDVQTVCWSRLWGTSVREEAAELDRGPGWPERLFCKASPAALSLCEEAAEPLPHPAHSLTSRHQEWGSFFQKWLSCEQSATNFSSSWGNDSLVPFGEPAGHIKVSPLSDDSLVPNIHFCHVHHCDSCVSPAFAGYIDIVATY